MNRVQRRGAVRDPPYTVRRQKLADAGGDRAIGHVPSPAPGAEWRQPRTTDDAADSVLASVKHSVESGSRRGVPPNDHDAGQARQEHSRNRAPSSPCFLAPFFSKARHRALMCTGGFFSAAW
jgi:hypothetical protein